MRKMRRGWGLLLCTALALAGCEQEGSTGKKGGTAVETSGAGALGGAGNGAGADAGAGQGAGTAADRQAASGRKPETEAIPYQREDLATGLTVPWEIDFAPDGRIFFTERSGKVRVIEKGKLVSEPVYVADGGLYATGEAGLLGLALDPNFAQNHYIYIYHSYLKGNQPTNRLLRLVESGNRAKLDKVLLDGLPASPIHDGGRVKFGPGGMLYFTNGDASSPSVAQDPKQLAGKIFRLRPDGTIPVDNPFPGSPVYSLGHRNPQGLAWQPGTNRMYSSEHGQTAHDELNLIEPGANYGWPLIEGDETKVKPGDESKLGPGPLRTPILHSGRETWAPSGIAFLTKGPWKGSLLMANLRGTQVLRVVLAEDGRSVKTVTPLFKGELGRIRAVAEGPDGSVYLLTNNRDGRGEPRPGDDRIVRLTPAF